MTDQKQDDGTLTEEYLKLISREFDIESIHTLNLSKKGYHNISVISGCTSLERLDLSANKISSLRPLTPLINITTLDLSDNNISVLNGIQALEQLSSLNLAGNQIGTIASLSPLRSLEKLKKVRFLDVVNNLTNPICSISVYKNQIVKHLPKIDTLDGCCLTGPHAKIFASLDELEEKLANKPKDSEVVVNMPAPLNEDMFNLPKIVMSDTMFQPVRENVESCLTLSSQAEHLIAEAESKLAAHEKV